MPPKKKPDTAGFDQLKKDLTQGKPGQLYIFHGEETYLRDSYLRKLQEVVLTGGLGEQLRQAQDCARREDWDQAEALTRQAFAGWQEHHLYLHCVMRHSDTDQILRSFQAVLEYLPLQEPDQYNAANADLIAQLELLAEMEQVSVANVL